MAKSKKTTAQIIEQEMAYNEAIPVMPNALAYTKAFDTFVEAMASLQKVSFSAHQSLMDSVGLHTYASYQDEYGDKIFTQEIGWGQFLWEALLSETADYENSQSWQTHQVMGENNNLTGVVGWHDGLAIRQMAEQWELVVQYDRLGSVTANAQKEGWTPLSESIIDPYLWVQEGHPHTLTFDRSRGKLWQLAATIARQSHDLYDDSWCEVEEAEVILYRENGIEPSLEMVEIQVKQISKWDHKSYHSDKSKPQMKLYPKLSSSRKLLAKMESGNREPRKRFLYFERRFSRVSTSVGAIPYVDGEFFFNGEQLRYRNHKGCKLLTATDPSDGEKAYFVFYDGIKHVESSNSFREAWRILENQQEAIANRAGQKERMLNGVICLNDIRNDREQSLVKFCFAGTVNWLEENMPYVAYLLKPYSGWSQLPEELASHKWELSKEFIKKSGYLIDSLK